MHEGAGRRLPLQPTVSGPPASDVSRTLPRTQRLTSAAGGGLRGRERGGSKGGEASVERKSAAARASGAQRTTCPLAAVSNPSLCAVSPHTSLLYPLSATPPQHTNLATRPLPLVALSAASPSPLASPPLPRNLAPSPHHEARRTLPGAPPGGRSPRVRAARAAGRLRAARGCAAGQGGSSLASTCLCRPPGGCQGRERAARVGDAATSAAAAAARAASALAPPHATTSHLAPSPPPSLLALQTSPRPRLSS